MSNNRKFCKKDCKHLEPTEEDQDNQEVKKPHFCKKYKRPVSHFVYHPELVRFAECTE